MFTNQVLLQLQASVSTPSGVPISSYVFFDGGKALGTNAAGSLMCSNLTIGTHYYSVKVTDANSYTAQSVTNTVSFVTNNTTLNPPTISLNIPTNNTAIGLIWPATSANIAISGTAYNGNGHAVTVILYTNGIPAVNANAINGSFGTNIIFSAGTVQVNAVAYSDGFYISSLTNTYNVYGVPNTISISPASGSYTNVGNVFVIVVANYSGPTATFITYDGGNPINTNGSGIFTWTPPLGNHSIWAKVIDSYGLIGQSTTNSIVLVTNRAPTITLTAPTNNVVKLSNPVTFTGTATNADGHAVALMLYVNNIGIPMMSSNGQFSTNVSLLLGTNQVYAVDQSDGFSVYSTTNTIRLASAPSLIWLSPSTGTYFWSFATNWQTLPSDVLGLTNGVAVSYYDNTSLLGKATASNSFTLAFTNLLTATTHTIIATVTNTYGLSTRSTNIITILADRAPTNVVLTVPGSNITNAPGAIQLQATAVDPDGDRIVLSFFDNTNLLFAVTNAPFQGTATFTNGTHFIHAVARSTTFTNYTATNSIAVDLAPSIGWVSPTSPTNYQYAVTLLQVSSTGAPLASVCYTNNGNWIGISSNSANNFALVYTNLYAGTNQFTAIATDIYGMTSKPITNSVLMTVLYPTVTWLSPLSATNIQYSTNSMQVSVTGNPIAQVVYTNNGVWAGTGTNATSNYGCPFMASTAGTNILVATATDIYGFSASSTNRINVQGLTFTPFFDPPACNSMLIPTVITPTVAANDDQILTTHFKLDGQTLTGAITNPVAGIQHVLIAECASVHGLQASVTNIFTTTEVATWKLVNQTTHSETPLSRNSGAYYKVDADNRYLVVPVYLNNFTPTALTVLQGPPGWQYASNQTAVQLSTNAGTLVIQVSPNSACGSAVYNFDLSGACITCTTCPVGGTKVANKSVNVRINLGSSAVSGTAGFLEVEQGRPTTALGTPQTLMYNFVRPDVQTLLDGNSYILQIKVPDGLFAVTTLSVSSYSVSFYPNSQVINSNGSYGATGYPSRVITLGNVGGDINHFQVNDSDKGIIADYYWLGTGWNMVTGGGLRQENRQEVDTGNQQAITRQILDGAGRLVEQTYEVWATLPTGTCLLLEVAGVGSNAKTNSYSYDDNGVLIQESHADGSWAMYQYDTQGRCTAKFSPFLNSQPSTNSTTGKMETYSYDPNMVFDQHQPVNDDGSILPNTPRCTINFIQGQEVSRQYTALLPNERIDVQCINPGDSFTTPGNLKTYTWYSTDVNHYGEVSKIIHP